MSTRRDANVSTAVEAAQADALREAMVAELRELKAIRSDQVAELVGVTGEVTTVDIDPDVVDRRPQRPRKRKGELARD